jgi:predicted nucleic acid-binding protein
VILVDANVPMYLVGADHPNKVVALRMLERAVSHRERLVTDAEVFQEILHRYVAIDRRDAVQPAFDALNAIVDETFAIDAKLVERAKDLVLGYSQLSARDAIHVASMQAHGVNRIMSFDTGFDVIPGMTRLGS